MFLKKITTNTPLQEPELIIIVIGKHALSAQTTD